MENPEEKGNLRDSASNMQLVVLSNLESHNAELIKQGISQEERYETLERVCEEQLGVLLQRQQNEIFKKKKLPKSK